MNHYHIKSEPFSDLKTAMKNAKDLNAISGIWFAVVRHDTHHEQDEVELS